MSKYRDPTESPEPPAPITCPLCRGKLRTRWSGIIGHTRSGYDARAIPSHECGKCQITVRVCVLPQRPLHDTKRAARASVAREVERRNAEMPRRRQSF